MSAQKLVSKFDSFRTLATGTQDDWIEKKISNVRIHESETHQIIDIVVVFV